MYYIVLLIYFYKDQWAIKHVGGCLEENRESLIEFKTVGISQTGKKVGPR